MLTFDEMLAQVTDLVQQQGRVSYRALKRRFNLDDDYLEDLKAELIDAKRLAVDEDGKVLVWVGEGINRKQDKRGNGQQSPESSVQSQESQTANLSDARRQTPDPKSNHRTLVQYETL